MNSKTIEQVSEEKDLGVIIDNELKFHTRTISLQTSLNKC